MLPLSRGRCVVPILVVPINNGGLHASRQHSASSPGSSVSAPADSDEYLSTHEFSHSSELFTSASDAQVRISELGAVCCVLSGGVYHLPVGAPGVASSTHPQYVYVRWRPILDWSGSLGCSGSCHLLRPLHAPGRPRLNTPRGDSPMEFIIVAVISGAVVAVCVVGAYLVGRYTRNRIRIYAHP